MDTTGEPLVLTIKRSVEEAIGIPVRVQQKRNNTFLLTLLDNMVTDPPSAED